MQKTKRYRPKVSDCEITADLYRRLNLRYSDEGWIVLHEVANKTGFNSRWADAIVLGVWPSRGHEIIGYEVKASRQDWMKELEAPSKADAIACYCDQWWILAADGVVKPDELPAGWGLKVPKGNDLLRVVAQAKKRKAKPLDRAFSFVLVRSLIRKNDADFQKAVREESAAELKSEYQRGRDDATHEYRRQLETLEQLTADVNEFEKITGVRVRTGWQYRNGKEERELFGQFVKGRRLVDELKGGGVEHLHQQLKFMFEKVETLRVILNATFISTPSIAEQGKGQ